MRFFNVLMCFSVIALIGCSTVSHKGMNGMPLPAQSFAHIKAIPVDVSEIDVHPAEDALMSVPDDFVFSVYDHAQAYLPRKFSAAPRDMANEQLVFRVQRADVTRAYVPSQKGLAKSLDVGGQDQYVIRLEIAAEHTGPDGHIWNGQVVTVTQTLAVSEHSSLADREEAQLRSIEALFAALDQELERVVLEDMRLGVGVSP